MDAALLGFGVFFVSFSYWIRVLPSLPTRAHTFYLFIFCSFLSLFLPLPHFPPFSQLFPFFLIFFYYIFLGPPLLWLKSSEGKVISCPMTRFVQINFYRRQRDSLPFCSCPLFRLIQNLVTNSSVCLERVLWVESPAGEAERIKFGHDWISSSN